MFGRRQQGQEGGDHAQFWKIVDGRLYLNSSEAAHKNLFLADTATVIRKGQSNCTVIYATQADRL